MTNKTYFYNKPLKDAFVKYDRDLKSGIDCEWDEWLDLPFVIKHNPLYLAVQLADYGMNGAGGDNTPEQQEWGAECLEAAIYLWRHTANAIVEEPPEKLQVGIRSYTEEELIAKVHEMCLNAMKFRKDKMIPPL